MRIEPLKPDDLTALEAAAREDQHVLLYPTHKIVDESGAFVGYLSICATPLVNVWLDRKRVKAFHSVRILKQLDAHLSRMGLKNYLMPCSTESPFFSRMARLGFKFLGATNYFVKHLK
jgi:hypothetical protein